MTRITRYFVYYLFFNKKVGAWTAQKLPYGLTRTALTSALFVPRNNLKFSWFLNKLIWLKNSFLKLRFLKRTKWLFWTLTPYRRPRECAFLFLFSNWSGCNQCNLEWLESNPQGHFVQCGIFPHEMTFCTESPSQAAQNVHFNGLEAWSALNKKKIFWPALYKLLKAKLIFSMGNYF